MTKPGIKGQTFKLTFSKDMFMSDIITHAHQMYYKKHSKALQEYMLGVYRDAGILQEDQVESITEMMRSPDANSRQLADDILESLNKTHDSLEIWDKLQQNLRVQRPELAHFQGVQSADRSRDGDKASD